jgi:tetratricopeptide (TPR) repeat protein
MIRHSSGGASRLRTPAAEAPLKLVLEDFVPYDQSTAWRIHDAYFADRGIAAWTGGDIPFAGTSNSGVALQHARLFVELVRELVESGRLRASEAVDVLEVGSGQGAFALNFIDALAHRCGAAGREIAARLRYVLSDYAPRNLTESTALPGLARLVTEGTIVPALFDLRRPEELTFLDEPRSKRRGRGSRPTRGFAAVFLNYICCVSPLKVVRSTETGLLEKYVALSVEVADEAEAKVVAEDLAGTSGGALPRPDLLDRLEANYEWRRLDLASAFGRSVHRKLLPALLEKLPRATVNYPWSFVDLLRGLRARLRPGGMFLVSDFGNPDRAIDGQSPTNDRAPVKYGVALTHDVDFVLFDAFAALEGLGVVRTGDGLFELHTVALRNMPEVPESFRATFDRTHARRAKGQELLDLSAAALVLSEAGRFHEAARLYQQCLRIAPRSVQVIYRFGQACLAANLESMESLKRLARLLRRGRRLDWGGRLDFDTLLGRVRLRLGEAAKARRLLERSLERSESAARQATLALACEALGDRERAYQAHRRALELEPAGEAAAEAMGKVFREYLAGADPPVGWVHREAR